MKKFPEHFIWGSATSAHQVEGSNINSDIWAEEFAEGSPYADKSGDGVDHYRRYREDIALMAKLGLKAYRFSIEWARIEPEPGCYSRSELDHYRDVLKACYEHGIMPMVTMHHFTSPRWLMRDGGWSNPQVAERFGQYVGFVFSELGDMIPYALTMNEVNLPIMLREMFINFDFMPPIGIDAKSWTAPGWRESAAKMCGADIENYFTFHMASDEESLQNVKNAHVKAREAIRQWSPSTKVGMSLALPDIQSVPGGEVQAEEVWFSYFKQFLPVIQDDDYLGIQNYTRELYGPEGQMKPPEGTELTGMGSEYYPEGLEGAVRKAAKDWSKPIIITEHGIATEDDSQRVRYIKRGLEGLFAAVTDGIPVQGYFYWSSFDNFEWIFGYSSRFGIIAVDRSNMERTVKNSGHVLGGIAQRGSLEE